tara:strand:- start:1581 stop:1811 length:231 start_codon:yes stop_codon:yes gene_type:complete
MGITATNILEVTNSEHTDLGPTTGFIVSGSSISGDITTRDGNVITLGNGFPTEFIPCSISEADSNNATTHILVFQY